MVSGKLSLSCQSRELKETLLEMSFFPFRFPRLLELPHIAFKCRGALEINYSVCTGQRVGNQLIEGMAFFFKQIVVLFYYP